jgi:hypothetical protein
MAEIPDTITKKHIEQALERLKNDEVGHSFGEAKKYEVEYEGERFAPKAVIGVAWQIATGKKVGPYDFYSGTTPQKAVGFLEDRGFKIVPKHKTYDAYLFTFKAEDWDEYEDFFERWLADHSETENWSSGTTKSVPSGVPFFLMKQGEHPIGIIASGVTVSKNRPMDRWSAGKNEWVSGRGNELQFEHFLDPQKDKLLDIADFGKQYWASRASGIGLPAEVYNTIKSRWSVLLGDNARETVKAKKAPALEQSDAADDYKIDNKDTRTIALKQIKERRGQGKFRQKLIDAYDGKCAISGCEIIDVLEACHIKSYLGDNDHHPENGLLLRADLHTLFDLLLLGINPVTKCIELHPSLHGSEYGQFQGKAILDSSIQPSFDALRLRWKDFKENCKR